MCFVRLTRETDRDHRLSREQLIILPGFDGEGRKKLVLADHYLGIEQSRCDEGFFEPHGTSRIDA